MEIHFLAEQEESLSHMELPYTLSEAHSPSMVRLLQHLYPPFSKEAHKAVYLTAFYPFISLQQPVSLVG